VKRFFIYFFATIFFAGYAIAEDAASISRVVQPSRAVPASSSSSSAETESARQSETSRVAITRNVVQKAPVAQNANPDLEEGENLGVSRVIPAVRSADNAAVSRRTTTNNVPHAADGGTVASRGGISRAVAVDSPTARENLEATVRTVGRNSRTQAASLNSSAAVRRAGLTLRPTTAEVGGRATIGGTDIQTGSNFDKARTVHSRAAAAPAKETITEATERLQQTADLNKSCQTQYNDCMDQFCAVIDANQKRCSCSSNLSKYTKVESAVKDANSQLNEVAQRIRYIGLSADEIRAIMSATEAELVLDSTKDNTESRSMLEEIEKLIKDPTSASSYSGDSYSGLNMDLDFSSTDSGDLFSLDFLSNNSSSFSNLRGTELYNAAKKRCNTVLNQCKSAGATAQQITGNYDLAIDKDCITYEQGLGKMNETLKTNVRSAQKMLQSARLAVLQDKNQYDAKGCISALNTCMTDDMVCGADYTKCLDPTKRYIDENGNVVLGQRIADIKDFMAEYNNASIDRAFLIASKNHQPVNPDTCKAGGNGGQCIVRYLLEKIGTGKTVTDGGLCRAVLDKCRRYTYGSSNDVYDAYNDVVVNYVQRAMVNIQAAQMKIISDYASSCMLDIASCYNQQVSQVNAWSSAASTDSVYNVMRGACRNVALTCAYAVFAGNDGANGICGTNACDDDGHINAVSEMFYQSLLCPDNSTYTETSKSAALTAANSANDITAINKSYVNERCKCDNNYTVYGKTCTRECTPGTVRNSLTGTCDSCPVGTFSTSGLEVGPCTPCGANGGYYCPAGAANSNTPCPANHYCSGGAAQPVACSSGQIPNPTHTGCISSGP
jgi:hypothetical protein